MDVITYVMWGAVAFSLLAWFWLKVMHQQCPECRQWIGRGAVRCRHCGASLD